MKNEFVIKRKNDIYLSDNDISILKRYKIDYECFNSFKELLFEIDEILNYDSFEELEDLSIKLTEYNYYFRTNK